MECREVASLVGPETFHGQIPDGVLVVLRRKPADDVVVETKHPDFTAIFYAGA
jgi:hypothetical protein